MGLSRATSRQLRFSVPKDVAAQFASPIDDCAESFESRPTRPNRKRRESGEEHT